jgi:thiol-disulfide isomerase/thioredoxin
MSDKLLLRVFFLFVIQALATQSFAADQATGKPVPETATPITVGETWRIRSRRLGEDRRIQVYLPTSYNHSRQRFPVIYALDGEGTGSIAANAVQFMTGYSAIPQMPEALVVAIINSDRNRDMPIPQSYGKGGEANFLAFLADELIPAIEQRYRTQPLRILLGHSQGGLFAHYAMIAKPNAFQWFLALDAPLYGFPEAQPIMEKVRDLVGKTPNDNGRLVTIENLYGWMKDWTSLAEAAPKGFYGARLEIKDETHESMAYKGIYEGLKRLFYDYAPNIVRDNKVIYTLPVLDERYKALSKPYGYPVDIPKPLLLLSATRNVAMQQGVEAMALVKRAAALYGESAQTNQILAEAEAAAAKGRDPRYEEWSNLPLPSLEQMKPFLGSWTEKRPEGFTGVISFEVIDGLVRSRFDGFPPQGEAFQLEVNFVRVLDHQTLQWGVRNGRGPGVTVHTAKLVNDTALEGATEDVGFLQNKPPRSFTFKRRVVDKKPSPVNLYDDLGQTKVSYSFAQMPRPGDKVKEVAIGAAAPDWRLQTPTGETIALSGLRGKVVILDFWANWCAPCRALEPLFDQLVREYHGKPVAFFTMSIWPDRDFNAKAYLNEHRMASTFVLGDNAVAKEYGIWGVPTYYVIDANGKVSYIHVLLTVNSEELGKRLREAIEKALRTEPSRLSFSRQ